MDEKQDNHDAEQRKLKYKLMFEFRGLGPFNALRDNVRLVSIPW